MLKIAILVGSTRPNRKSEAVARWVYEQASQRSDAEFELIDLREVNLPLFDEPLPPSRRQYTHEHTKAWSAKIAAFDAFIFVTPEYNHSIPGVLKNAIDFLYYEWHDKAAAFVSYGTAGGSRAVEHLRGVMGELRIADVKPQLLLYNATDFDNTGVLMPTEKHLAMLTTVLDKLVQWGVAMQSIRMAGG